MRMSTDASFEEKWKTIHRYIFGMAVTFYSIVFCIIVHNMSFVKHARMSADAWCGV